VMAGKEVTHGSRTPFNQKDWFPRAKSEASTENGESRLPFPV